MNGITDAYLDYWIEAQQGDDDDLWCSTDIECPFCGHPIDWKVDRLVCDNCEVTWQDGAEVETDRRQLLARDEPAAMTADDAPADDPPVGWSDVFAEERGAL